MALSLSKKLIFLAKFSGKIKFGPNYFNGEFYQSFRDLSPILHCLSQKIEEEGNSFTHFVRLDFVWVKSDKDSTKKENYRHNIFHEFRHKNPQ